MTSIAHIVNPVRVPPTSDLFAAQPVTFAAIRRARESASRPESIQLFSAQFPEDRDMVPAGFTAVPDLTRSVQDEGSFQHPRKLPLLYDILERLYTGSQAEYLIYSNVDIAPMPYFYSSIQHLTGLGFDGFAVNRRTISGRYKFPSDLPLMYAEAGEKHKGWDCFIFHRSLFPEFKLGTACIGSGWIGRIMIINLACLAKKFHIFSDFHLTFHIGNQKIWRDSSFRDYTIHNRREGKQILDYFDQTKGPLARDTIPGSFYRTWRSQSSGPGEK
jgi:hypothetical protein